MYIYASYLCSCVYSKHVCMWRVCARVMDKTSHIPSYFLHPLQIQQHPCIVIMSIFHLYLFTLYFYFLRWNVQVRKKKHLYKTNFFIIFKCFFLYFLFFIWVEFSGCFFLNSYSRIHFSWLILFIRKKKQYLYRLILYCFFLFHAWLTIILFYCWFFFRTNFMCDAQTISLLATIRIICFE